MTNLHWLWLTFGVVIAVMLAIDLGVFNRRTHELSRKEAIFWSLVWITLSLAFAGGVARFMSPEKGLEFLTGWIIEKSLSVDNLFVFILIFDYFQVKSRMQHRILFWGILGALVLRGILIWAGSALIVRFHWILYFFGAFLLYTAFRMVLQKDGVGVEPGANPVVRFFRRHFRVTDDAGAETFFTRIDGKLWATPLFIVVLVVETTDVVFAVDSIPAIFGVTTDAFIIYTSNVFALLGLRALYFLLAGLLGLFRFLKFGIAIVLGFIGLKMLMKDIYHIPTIGSLAVVGGILALSVLLSIAFPAVARQKEPPEEER